MSKHHHNDYKRQIGLDQSRTASEKLLDKFMSKQTQQPKRQITLQSQKPIEKKVKKQQGERKPMEYPQLVKKVVKILKNQTQSEKLLKAISLLRKCLGTEEFVSAISNIEVMGLINALFQIDDHIRKLPLVEMIKVIDQIIEMLEQMSKKFTQQINEQIKQRIQVKKIYLQMITDDSFTFHKELAKLKEKLFAFFTNIEEKQENLFHEQLLFSLMSLPNLSLEWVKASLTTLLKEFIIEHKEKLSQAKEFLKQYNIFLQTKTVSREVSGSNIMGEGKKISKGQFTALESQDSSSRWCQRQ